MFRRALLSAAARSRRLAAIACCFALLVTQTPSSRAGQRFFRNNSIGGISIDGAGVVRQRTVKAKNLLYELLKKEVSSSSEQMTRPVGLRMISLRVLEDAVDQASKKNFGSLPDELEFLGGLQRIEYVFLYPEQKDIVLAGPGEGWRIDENANVVGITTGRPVLLLDDLLVAFRSASGAREGYGISCSIDPTEEGRVQFQRYISSLGSFANFNRSLAEQAMGSQRITITGVPATSHFARVLVAADFRMKRYAMGLEGAPIRGFPSFLDLMKTQQGRLTNAIPRWWLTSNYEPIARSEDGLAWQLRGTGVKALTEDDFIERDGTLKGSGGKNPIAQQWADMMTEKYSDLLQKEAIFGELRNLMDMCVVAALIEKEGMLKTVGLSLPLLMGQDSDLTVDQWNAPKTVGTQCSFMKMGRQYIITASGGVQIESWEVAGKSEISNEVQQVRSRAKGEGKEAWWWH